MAARRQPPRGNLRQRIGRRQRQPPAHAEWSNDAVELSIDWCRGAGDGGHHRHRHRPGRRRAHRRKAFDQRRPDHSGRLGKLVGYNGNVDAAKADGADAAITKTTAGGGLAKFDSLPWAPTSSPNQDPASYIGSSFSLHHHCPDDAPDPEERVWNMICTSTPRTPRLALTSRL